jgi:plasmid stability protein
MRRIQVQVDDGMYKALRQRAVRRKQSVAAAVRELLALELPSSGRRTNSRNRMAAEYAPLVTYPKRLPRSIKEFTFIGSGSGRPGDRVSERHDEVLAEGPW